MTHETKLSRNKEDQKSGLWALNKLIIEANRTKRNLLLQKIAANFTQGMDSVGVKIQRGIDSTATEIQALSQTSATAVLEKKQAHFDKKQQELAHTKQLAQLKDEIELADRQFLLEILGDSGAKHKLNLKKLILQTKDAWSREGFLQAIADGRADINPPSFTLLTELLSNESGVFTEIAGELAPSINVQDKEELKNLLWNQFLDFLNEVAPLFSKNEYISYMASSTAHLFQLSCGVKPKTEGQEGGQSKPDKENKPNKADIKFFILELSKTWPIEKLLSADKPYLYGVGKLATLFEKTDENDSHNSDKRKKGQSFEDFWQQWFAEVFSFFDQENNGKVTGIIYGAFADIFATDGTNLGQLDVVNYLFAIFKLKDYFSQGNAALLKMWDKTAEIWKNSKNYFSGFDFHILLRDQEMPDIDLYNLLANLSLFGSAINPAANEWLVQVFSVYPEGFKHIKKMIKSVPSDQSAAEQQANYGFPATNKVINEGPWAGGLVKNLPKGFAKAVARMLELSRLFSPPRLDGQALNNDQDNNPEKRLGMVLDDKEEPDLENLVQSMLETFWPRNLDGKYSEFVASYFLSFLIEYNDGTHQSNPKKMEVIAKLVFNYLIDSMFTIHQKIEVTKQTITKINLDNLRLKDALSHACDNMDEDDDMILQYPSDVFMTRLSTAFKEFSNEGGFTKQKVDHVIKEFFEETRFVQGIFPSITNSINLRKKINNLSQLMTDYLFENAQTHDTNIDERITAENNFNQWFDLLKSFIPLFDEKTTQLLISKFDACFDDARYSAIFMEELPLKQLLEALESSSPMALKQGQSMHLDDKLKNQLAGVATRMQKALFRSSGFGTGVEFMHLLPADTAKRVVNLADPYIAGKETPDNKTRSARVEELMKFLLMMVERGYALEKIQSFIEDLTNTGIDQVSMSVVDQFNLFFSDQTLLHDQKISEYRLEIEELNGQKKLAQEKYDAELALHHQLAKSEYDFNSPNDLKRLLKLGLELFKDELDFNKLVKLIKKMVASSKHKQLTEPQREIIDQFENILKPLTIPREFESNNYFGGGGLLAGAVSQRDHIQVIGDQGGVGAEKAVVKLAELLETFDAEVLDSDLLQELTAELRAKYQKARDALSESKKQVFDRTWRTAEYEAEERDTIDSSYKQEIIQIDAQIFAIEVLIGGENTAFAKKILEKLTQVKKSMLNFDGYIRMNNKFKRPLPKLIFNSLNKRVEDFMIESGIATNLNRLLKLDFTAQESLSGGETD